MGRDKIKRVRRGKYYTNNKSKEDEVSERVVTHERETKKKEKKTETKSIYKAKEEEGERKEKKKKKGNEKENRLRRERERDHHRVQSSRSAAITDDIRREQ